MSSTIGGVVAGITAVWVYAYRKNSEYVSTRNDMAIILANEIRRNLRSYTLPIQGPCKDIGMIEVRA